MLTTSPNVGDFAAIKVTRLQPRIGAEIAGVDLARGLSDVQRDEVYEALLRYRVVVFRNQPLDREAHMRVGRQFAPLYVAPRYAAADCPPEISLIVSNGMDSVGAAVWHSDNSYDPVPPMASMLRSCVIPRLGGDTAFASAVAAYESLKDGTKARIEGLQALHRPWSDTAFERFSKVARAKGDAVSETFLAKVEHLTRTFPGTTHPVVRLLETGERALFVNRGFTREIVGMDPVEGQQLLNELFDAVRIPENQMRFSWSADAVAFWDNRAAQHYAVTDYDEPRRMERVTLAGAPVRAPCADAVRDIDLSAPGRQVSPEVET